MKNIYKNNKLKKRNIILENITEKQNEKFLKAVIEILWME